MELKTIFQMTKTDRYTQDGRDELAKLQETEDVKYKTGDISQKTGLQKQPDGSWAPPKKGAGNKSAAGGEKPAEKHPPMVMPKGMHPAEFMKAWEDDAKKNDYKKGQGNEWREHLRNEESKPAAEKKPSIPTDKEVSNSLDELSNSKEMASKVIGGVKVTYNPENGFYKVTHKAPGGQEVSRGCSDILEAQQAVMFRLDRIKKGEIPAISESAESKPTENKPADMLSSKDPAILNKYKPETEEEKNEIKKMQQFMEEETGATLRNAILARESYYNNSPSEYKNEAGKAALSNIKKIFGYGTQKDAAPRQLTGDCKIRVKK